MWRIPEIHSSKLRQWRDQDEISYTEIEKAVKQMRNNKAPGPSGITAEMIKALDEVGVNWLHTILNEFPRDERIPGDLKESEIVTIYKQKRKCC